MRVAWLLLGSLLTITSAYPHYQQQCQNSCVCCSPPVVHSYSHKCCTSHCNTNCNTTTTTTTTVPPSIPQPNQSGTSSHTSSHSSNNNIQNSLDSEITIPIDIANTVNNENRIHVPVTVDSTNVNNVHVRIIAPTPTKITPEKPPPPKPRENEQSITTTTSTTTTTTTSTEKPYQHPKIIYVHRPMYYPQPQCCVIVQPCLQQHCPQIQHCGQECTSSHVYQPHNPCLYQKCERREYVQRRVCTEQSCSVQRQSCSGCYNNNWYSTYHGYQQCKGCYHSSSMPSSHSSYKK